VGGHTACIVSFNSLETQVGGRKRKKAEAEIGGKGEGGGEADIPY
jgi:hypothetical protein